jgi:hypothetical protein
MSDLGYNPQRGYFVSYANGKSAVRVTGYGELPKSLNHYWELPEWMKSQVRAWNANSIHNILVIFPVARFPQ